MNNTKLFLKSVLAGICISIGCVAAILTQDAVISSIILSTGFFLVLMHGVSLFTFDIQHILFKSPKHIVKTALEWVGNFIGALLAGGLLLLTSGISKLSVGNVQTDVNALLNESLVSVFILSVFCGILLYSMSHGYRTLHSVGRVAVVILGTMVIANCGFKHCVFNMFYFTIAGTWVYNGFKAFGYLLIITLGNAVGCLFFPFVKVLCDIVENDNKKEEKDD